MKKLTFLVFSLITTMLVAQENTKTKPHYQGKISSVEYVSPIMSRTNDLVPFVDSNKEAKDKRSIANQIVSGQDPQTEDDYFVRNKHEKEQSMRMAAAGLTFDTYSSSSQPTDPSLAVGPNHVMVVFNTGFAVYDKSGTQLLAPTAPNPAIFPSGGCCDLTVSYDNAADRWVLSFLNGAGAGAQIAISDGPNPLTAGWYIYNVTQIADYQKLSVWSDGYYITENTTGANNIWVLERDAMLTGDTNAEILGFSLPGIVTSGFFSPQVLNVTDNNLPATGGATVVYLQDNAWSGVSTDHIKLWTIDVNWTNTSSSTISPAQQIPVTPFISVFDGGSFSNLTQPGGGPAIDALQATIMNQAQFRKFATHNSAVFNFVVDTDASGGELAGVRWMEFRQNGDNQPWSLYQEGTYTAPDGRHAWNASIAMDSQGNMGMGYTSMSGPSTPSTVRVSSYFTGRLNGDPLGTMTAMEGLIANGNQNIPGTRYGDYAKIDVDPSNDSTFWFITEYMNSGRKGVVGTFEMESAAPDTEAPTNPSGLTATNITSNSATLNWTAATDNVGVVQYNISIDGTQVGTSATTTFDVTGLSAVTTYSASVTAQDAAGNVSGAVSTSFTTLDATSNCSGGVSVPYSESFESSIGDWTQDTANDDINWTRDSGGTPSNNTGPSSGSNGSWYMYVEASGNGTGYPNKRAILNSPCLDLTGETEVNFTFDYHMFGSTNGGRVDLEASTDGSTWTSLWNAQGNNGNQWNGVTISLNAYAGGTVQLRFNRITGGTWQSDVAIDNINLTAGGVDNNPPTGYCSSNGQIITDEFISRVQLGSIDNTTGASTGGYGDYTSQSTNLSATNTITITPTWTGTIFNEGYAVWIDYNRDGDFADSGELVLSQAPTTATPISGSFTVPSGASNGPTRMRVSMKYNGIPSPCESFQYGEVEDYIVVIGASGRSELLDFTEHANNTIVLSPNPAKSVLNIEILDGNYDEIMIFSTSGKLVHTTKKGTGLLSVDVSQFATGAYFVKFISNGRAITKRFIKK